jgi:hypothetical protein
MPLLPRGYPKSHFGRPKQGKEGGRIGSKNSREGQNFALIVIFFKAGQFYREIWESKAWTTPGRLGSKFGLSSYP